MPKPSQREIDESYDREGLVLDSQDEALLQHVLLEDQLPQGLHQQGARKIANAEEDNYLYELQ
jgi:hypothetical protein